MVSAAILIGGRARRLDGQFKPLITIAGRSILDRQLDALAAAGLDDVVLVGNWPSQQRAPRAVFGDAIPDSGSIGAVYTALLVGTSDRMIVLAGDMPFVTAPLITALADASMDDEVVLPGTRDGLQPLCGCYRRSTARHLKARIDRGELRLRDAVSTLRARVLDESELSAIDADRMMLMNVNTPADYERAVAARDRS